VADNSSISIEVQGGRITASLPGTSFFAVFHRSPDGKNLVQGSGRMLDSNNPLSREDFEALAWEAACQKARELGWLDGDVLNERSAKLLAA
jgi:hypothetical protein